MKSRKITLAVFFFIYLQYEKMKKKKLKQKEVGARLGRSKQCHKGREPNLTHWEVVKIKLSQWWTS